MKYLHVYTAIILLLMVVGCNNSNTVKEEPVDSGKFLCDLFLDLGYGSDGVFLIEDSNLYRFLDTVCSLLSESNSKQSGDFYRNLIIDAREEGTKRCILVEQNIPYSVWLNIYNLPGWRHGVIKMVDGKSVVLKESCY